MPELTIDFRIPALLNTNTVIQLAQDRYNIKVAPLELFIRRLGRARSSYLVSVSNSNETKRVEHCILKLDRKGKNAKIG